MSALHVVIYLVILAIFALPIVGIVLAIRWAVRRRRKG